MENIYNKLKFKRTIFYAALSLSINTILLNLIFSFLKRLTRKAVTIIITFHESFFSIAFAATLSIISIPHRFPLIEATNGGFSVDLIHRDSPESPLYNPSLTHSQRVLKSFQRSFHRANSLVSISLNSASSQAIASGGEYLMKISIGTPAFETLAYDDTGSDLPWTQCNPCYNCFPQQIPLFTPNNSSTYIPISCSSDRCKAVLRPTCLISSNTCQYTVNYFDGGYGTGDLAVEKFTLGSNNGEPALVANLVFGCGRTDFGNFFNGSGIIGLGVGAFSLTSQLHDIIKGKFSHCFVPRYEISRPSQLNFGQKGVVSGEGVVSTPLSENIHYLITMEGISVGEKTLNFYNLSSSLNVSSDFNTLIDSGTTYTFLPPEFYQRVESELINVVQSEVVPDPQRLFKVCYSSLVEAKVPIFTIHFKGADVQLNPVNSFYKTSYDLICFAIGPLFNDVTDNMAIFGNWARTNFLVGYDREKSTVSFKPTDCSKIEV